MIQALLANNRLGWKCFPESKSLAYWTNSENDFSETSFIEFLSDLAAKRIVSGFVFQHLFIY